MPSAARSLSKVTGVAIVHDHLAIKGRLISSPHQAVSLYLVTGMHWGNCSRKCTTNIASSGFTGANLGEISRSNWPSWQLNKPSEPLGMSFEPAWTTVHSAQICDIRILTSMGQGPVHSNCAAKKSATLQLHHACAMACSHRTLPLAVLQ